MRIDAAALGLAALIPFSANAADCVHPVGSIAVHYPQPHAVNVPTNVAVLISVEPHASDPTYLPRFTVSSAGGAVFGGSDGGVSGLRFDEFKNAPLNPDTSYVVSVTDDAGAGPDVSWSFTTGAGPATPALAFSAAPTFTLAEYAGTLPRGLSCVPTDQWRIDLSWPLAGPAGDVEYFAFIDRADGVTVGVDIVTREATAEGHVPAGTTGDLYISAYDSVGNSATSPSIPISVPGRPSASTKKGCDVGESGTQPFGAMVGALGFLSMVARRRAAARQESVAHRSSVFSSARSFDRDNRRTPTWRSA